MTETVDEIVTACLLIIGNEILSGRTQDANLAFIAKKLGGIGVRLREVRVIPDVAETIVATVNEVRAKFDYVFTTGGIGPTHDDITSETIAQAFGVAWVVNDEAKRLLLTHYKDSELNAARLRMATIPDGAILIDNPVSLAPGFQIGNVFVMAGVPRIMQAMLDGILPRLKRGAPMLSRTIRCTLPEGIIADGLGKLQDRYPGLDVGSYPYFRRGAFGTALVVRGTDEARVTAAAAELAALIRSLGGDPLEGEAPEA